VQKEVCFALRLSVDSLTTASRAVVVNIPCDVQTLL